MKSIPCPHCKKRAGWQCWEYVCVGWQLLDDVLPLTESEDCEIACWRLLLEGFDACKACGETVS